jgi:hypothetical protein
MKSHRAVPEVPMWMRDPRIRQKIADSIRRRRAKRKDELAKYEHAVRMAGEVDKGLRKGV